MFVSLRDTKLRLYVGKTKPPPIQKKKKVFKFFLKVNQVSDVLTTRILVSILLIKTWQ